MEYSRPGHPISPMGSNLPYIGEYQDKMRFRNNLYEASQFYPVENPYENPPRNKFDLFDRKEKVFPEMKDLPNSQIKKDLFTDPLQMISKNLTIPGWKVNFIGAGFITCNSYTLNDILIKEKKIHGLSVEKILITDIDTDMVFNPTVLYESLLEELPKLIEFENLRRSKFNEKIGPPFQHQADWTKVSNDYQAAFLERNKLIANPNLKKREEFDQRGKSLSLDLNSEGMFSENNFGRQQFKNPASNNMYNYPANMYNQRDFEDAMISDLKTSYGNVHSKVKTVTFR